MNTEESLYIKILVWAYERSELGFTWEDLQKEFDLTKDQQQWVNKIFRSNMPISENLIDHLNYNPDQNIYKYFITAKGTSSAIEYLNLQEAKITGKRAEKISWVAIGIGIIVGIAQIITQINFK